MSDLGTYLENDLKRVGSEISLMETRKTTLLKRKEICTDQKELKTIEKQLKQIEINLKTLRKLEVKITKLKAG